MKKNEETQVGGVTPEAGVFDEMAYFVGSPKGSYHEALGELARHGDVKSCLTSSLPLTEFWRPCALNRISALLRPFLAGVDFASASKFLEFPTDPVLAGRTVGWPSMTDLMIFDGNWRIAIEAKFTEYVRCATQKVAAWYADKRGRAPSSARRTILRAWLEMIVNAGCSDLEPTDTGLRKLDGIGYQFLHRTASACHAAKNTEGGKAALVYQLFYRQGNAAHIAKLEACKERLRSWAGTLGLKNMTFLIVSVPIVNADQVERKYRGRKSDLFDTMRSETIYRFDFDGIEVEDVIGEGGR